MSKRMKNINIIRGRIEAGASISQEDAKEFSEYLSRIKMTIGEEIDRICEVIGPGGGDAEQATFLFAYVDAMEELLDAGDQEDAFGSEGWRHRIGFD